MMSGSKKGTGPLRFLTRHRMKLRMRRLTPLLVWLSALAVAGTLYIRQETGLTVTGYAEEIRRSVASETDGRLQRLEVMLNQDVNRGQIVASIENDELLLQLQAARSELDRLAHELGREKALWDLEAAGQQNEQQTNLRRFARDVSSARIEYLDVLAELAEDRIEIQGLELNLNRTRQLEQSELTSVAMLDQDRIAFEALNEKIAKQESTVSAMLTAHRDAETRYREFLDHYVVETPDPELLLKPLESGIKVQEIRIEMVNLAISKCVLRAPADGRVVEIFRYPGEIVAAGQPVLSILEPQATELVAYIPEHRILDLQTDAEVRVRRIADPARIFISTISYLGSSVDQMPERLDPAAMTPGWGLAVFIPLPGSLAVKPGEAFEVSF